MGIVCACVYLSDVAWVVVTKGFERWEEEGEDVWEGLWERLSRESLQQQQNKVKAQIKMAGNKRKIVTRSLFLRQYKINVFQK